MTLSKLLYYLERLTSTVINLDALHPAFYTTNVLDLAPEQHLHRGKFCEFAKRNSFAHQPCSENKRESQRLAAMGKPLTRVCLYGIWELIWPVVVDNTPLAVVYFSHIATQEINKDIGGNHYLGPDPTPYSMIDQSQLRKSAEFIASFIGYEVAMYDLEGHGTGKQKQGVFYRDFCLRYIERNYRDQVRLYDVAKTLRISPNYLSERIKHECGKGFSKLLNEKRLEVACTYLEFELTISVTDIAYMCGFSDSNYFSAVFHKYLGMSPRAYRRRSAFSQNPDK